MTIPAPTIKDWPLRTTMPANSLISIVEPSSGDTSKFVFAKIAAANIGTSGSGTVNAGTINQFAFYSAAGTAVSGTSLVAQLASGRVGINGPTDDTTSALQVNGAVKASGAVSALSASLTVALATGSGGTGANNAAGARTNLGLSAVAFNVDFSQGAVVANGTIIVVRKAPFAFSIGSLDYEVGSAGGSFTVAVVINSTNVTGLSAVAVSSATSANALATAANTVNAGDKVSIVITATSGSPTGANLQINGTR